MVRVTLAPKRVRRGRTFCVLLGEYLGTKSIQRVSIGSTARESTMFFGDASRRWRTRVSFGEPIALRGQELEQVAAATSNEARVSGGGEAQFIERLRVGEAAAFDRLVQERSGDVYALLYRMTEDAEEARDLTQETFLRIFQSIERFRGDADLKTWIYRIAINQARNRWRWWRRRRRETTFSLDALGLDDGPPLVARLQSATASPEQETLAHEREMVLGKALRTLGRSYRETVILRDVEGL